MASWRWFCVYTLVVCAAVVVVDASLISMQESGYHNSIIVCTDVNKAVVTLDRRYLLKLCSNSTNTALLRFNLSSTGRIPAQTPTYIMAAADGSDLYNCKAIEASFNGTMLGCPAYAYGAGPTVVVSHLLMYNVDTMIITSRYDYQQLEPNTAADIAWAAYWTVIVAHTGSSQISYHGASNVDFSGDPFKFHVSQTRNLSPASTTALSYRVFASETTVGWWDTTNGRFRWLNRNKDDQSLTGLAGINTIAAKYIDINGCNPIGLRGIGYGGTSNCLTADTTRMFIHVGSELRMYQFTTNTGSLASALGGSPLSTYTTGVSTCVHMKTTRMKGPHLYCLQGDANPIQLKASGSNLVATTFPIDANGKNTYHLSFDRYEDMAYITTNSSVLQYNRDVVTLTPVWTGTATGTTTRYVTVAFTLPEAPYSMTVQVFIDSYVMTFNDTQTCSLLLDPANIAVGLTGPGCIVTAWTGPTSITSKTARMYFVQYQDIYQNTAVQSSAVSIASSDFTLGPQLLAPTANSINNAAGVALSYRINEPTRISNANLTFVGLTSGNIVTFQRAGLYTSTLSGVYSFTVNVVSPAGGTNWIFNYYSGAFTQYQAYNITFSHSDQLSNPAKTSSVSPVTIVTSTPTPTLTFPTNRFDVTTTTLRVNYTLPVIANIGTVKANFIGYSGITYVISFTYNILSGTLQSKSFPHASPGSSSNVLSMTPGATIPGGLYNMTVQYAAGDASGGTINLQAVTSNKIVDVFIAPSTSGLVAIQPQNNSLYYGAVGISFQATLRPDNDEIAIEFTNNNGYTQTWTVRATPTLITSSGVTAYQYNVFRLTTHNSSLITGVTTVSLSPDDSVPLVEMNRPFNITATYNLRGNSASYPYSQLLAYNVLIRSTDSAGCNNNLVYIVNNTVTYVPTTVYVNASVIYNETTKTVIVRDTMTQIEVVYNNTVQVVVVPCETCPTCEVCPTDPTVIMDMCEELMGDRGSVNTAGIAFFVIGLASLVTGVSFYVTASVNGQRSGYGAVPRVSTTDRVAPD
jgi:hypothetical protein